MIPWTSIIISGLLSLDLYREVHHGFNRGRLDWWLTRTIWVGYAILIGLALFAQHNKEKLMIVPAGIPKSAGGKPLTKIKKLDYWQVEGQSHKGNAMKRNGARVVCGHKHKNANACQPCLRRMRRTKPGNCQHYAIDHFEGMVCVYSKQGA